MIVWEMDFFIGLLGYLGLPWEWRHAGGLYLVYILFVKFSVVRVKSISELQYNN